MSKARISMARVVAALNVPQESATEFIVVVDGGELRISQDGDLYIIDGTRRGYHSCMPLSRAVYNYVNGK